MTNPQQETYKSLGFELMREFAGAIGAEEKLDMGGPNGEYQTLYLEDGMTLRFTAWRNGTMPFYIILFDKGGHYIFELDLSMIVLDGDALLWHLKAPSNTVNRTLLNDWLGDVRNFDEIYCQAVKTVKEELESGQNTPRQGYQFLTNRAWSEACDKFIELMGRVVAAHGGKELGASIHEASNDDDPSYGRRKIRRGQAQFRLNLVRLYEGKCAFTGTGLAEVVEAAHIVKHSESGINHTDNGMLLRADVHRLFDANLIAVDPENLKIKVAPDLAGTEYNKLTGKRLRKRVNGTYPNREYLLAKWEEAGLEP